MGKQREARSLRAVHKMHIRQYIHLNRARPHFFASMVVLLLLLPLQCEGKLPSGDSPFRTQASEYDAIPTAKGVSFTTLSTSNNEDEDSTKTHTHHKKIHVESLTSPGFSPVASPVKEAQKPSSFEQFQSFADQKSKFLSEIQEVSLEGSSPEAPFPGTQPSPASEKTLLFPGKPTIETEQELSTEERTSPPKKSASHTPSISPTPETEPKIPRRCTGLIETRCCRWKTTNCPCGSHPDGSFCVAVKIIEEKHLTYKIYSGWHIVGQCKCPTHFVS